MNADVKTCVVIATTGRSEIVARTVAQLSKQTCPPDLVLVIGASEEDVALVATGNTIKAIISRKGLCIQRNYGLNYVGDNFDIVLFFDDDFLPDHNYVKYVKHFFQTQPDLVGATGVLVADGAHGTPIEFDAARRRIDSFSAPMSAAWQETTWLYGCNMAMRTSALNDLRFDEALPLYGWQEDVDFSSRLARFGKLGRFASLTGIHLGTRSGRTPGIRLGYSQVANIIYLRRKGTIRAAKGWTLMLRNITANIVKSLFPEPHIDRRGRLRGNLQAIGDFLLGRIDPRKILTL